MQKYAFLYLLLTFILLSCNSDGNNISYDASVKDKVLSVLNKSNTYNKFSASYDNQLLIQYFEDDSLALDTFDKDQMLAFISTHKKTDSGVIMEGRYGVFGGYGYTIKINGDKAEVYYTINSNETPAPYSLSEDAELTNSILVPAKHFDLTISTKPKGAFGEIIYGVVEFESEDYYKMDYQTLHRRQKINTNMKIYFKSLAVK